MRGELRVNWVETGNIPPQRTALRRGPVPVDGHLQATQMGRCSSAGLAGRNRARPVKWFPWKSTCSPEKRAETISKPSSSLSARVFASAGSPNAENSSGGSPNPTPRIALPCERPESVANSLATFHGLRLASGVTRAPKETLVVDAARAPRMVVGSTEGKPSVIKWSQMKKPSQPDASVSCPRPINSSGSPNSPQLGR